MNGKPFSHSPKPAKNTHIDADKYVEMYANSIADPVAFWGEHGKRIDWIKPYTTVKDVSFVPGDIRINWCKTRSNNGPQKRLHSAVVAE